MRFEDQSISAWNWNDLGKHEPEFLDTFRGFCRLLLECRRRAVELSSSKNAPDSEADEMQEIRRLLLEAFESQKRRISRESGPYGVELFREVEYVEAVLADEVFLTLEWPGRKFWTTHLLEAQLFGTHSAGEMFFTRVDSFLTDRHAGPEGLEALYFLALSLGFQGKYRDRQDQTSIPRYKRELYRRYYSKNPTGVDKLQYAFPACYEHTLDSFVPRLRPSPSRWIVILLAAVLTWLIITQVVWSSLTNEVFGKMKVISRQSNSVSSGVADVR